MKNPTLLIFTTLMLLLALLPGAALAQQAVTCESDVIVQEGDWLSTIAEAAYGDPTLYPAIVEATNAKAQSDSSYATIGSHDAIEPGWKLCLPVQPEAESLESAAPVDDSVLTVEELINATYSGIYDEPVTLTEGKYEGEPFVEGDSSRPVVEYLGEEFGDLDGDGLEDAAVFLVENSGGSGNFVYVAAQLNQNGAPVDAGAVWIEDRIQIISAVIENGQVMLEITAEGPGDAACCKSHKTSKTYALQNGQLAEIPGEEAALEKISAADLNGTSWTLLELDTDQPALADAPITLSFTGDQLSGSGGCNSYNGSFTLGADNPFVMTVGPLAATQMACPEPILNQETAYLAALQGVSQWGYLIGDLVLYYGKEDGTLGRLLFTPSAAASPATAAGERSTRVAELTATPWQWVSFTDPVEQFDIADPENYTIAFNPDGTVNVKADCNNAAGTYAADDSGSLTIEIGPMTLAACPPDSRSDEFVQNLGFVRGFFIEEGFLYLDMLADGGTLKFSGPATP
jgi:heat shock protein HslJ